MEDWILLVIVIVIIYLFASGTCNKWLNIGTYPSAPVPSDPVPSAPVVDTAPIVLDVPLEGEAKKEQLETKLINEGIIATNCEPESCVGDLSFAKHEYGLPGIEFSEWAMYQTLDPRIVASNNQFVADRLGNPQTWTGASYSPDRHDTWDAVPWRGLSRPARVEVSSPDQIPDIDTNRYPTTKKFRWNSSEVE